MTLIVDTAPLVALADRNDPAGPIVRGILERERGELFVPAPVCAEVDYLLGRRLGRPARLAFIQDLAAGRFTVEGLGRADHTAILDLERRYDNLDAGLADLSVVIVAARRGTHRVMTFDRRDFRSLRPLDGGNFTLLPFDGP